jgi:hypothetical protein
LMMHLKEWTTQQGKEADNVKAESQRSCIPIRYTSEERFHCKSLAYFPLWGPVQASPWWLPLCLSICHEKLHQMTLQETHKWFTTPNSWLIQLLIRDWW